MKKALIIALLAIAASFSASAQSIDAFFDKVKSNFNFSAMSLPKEQCRQNDFDSMDLAVSGTVTISLLQDRMANLGVKTADVLATLRKELATIPADQRLAEVNEAPQYVSIYSKPLSGGKAQVLLFVINSKNGVVLKGICDQKTLDKNLNDLHLNNIFGN